LNAKEGSSLHWEVEPWPEPVEGGVLLDGLEGVLGFKSRCRMPR
jgi:hypothetical protein